MHKSFIERIFPHAPDGGLPRYEDESPARTSTSDAAMRIQMRDSSLSPSARSPSRKYVQASPLSASIGHHDNPFLAVERAAKALQRTIQSYLDAQSDGLHASLADTGPDDHSSVGSPTPTPSTATPSRSSSLPKTVPVRQPVPRKITLRGARRGLSKAMEEFAQLRQEELGIIDSESASRQSALKRGKRFQEKRSSLIREMDSIRGEDSATQATTYRQEADKIKTEIQAIEATLFELRARYRQLITQADQHENTIDSKLSSYKSSLSMVENDMKQFLRHPPVDHTLPLFEESSPSQGSMYALKPERRTLEMAQDQWTAERELLAHRKADVETERQALQEGVKIWREATRRISEFEKTLRHALRHPPVTTTGSAESSSSNYEDQHSALLSQLNDLIASLQADLATAESNSWNLLICCLGAELEALDQGRILLGELRKNLTLSMALYKPVHRGRSMENHHQRTLLKTYSTEPRLKVRAQEATRA